MFVEATEEDLRAMGASDKAVEVIKRRKKKRGYGFDRGDDRAKTDTESPKSKKDSTQKALPGSSGGPLSIRAADKGSALAKSKSSKIKPTDKVQKAKVKVHNQPQRPGTTRPTPSQQDDEKPSKRKRELAIRPRPKPKPNRFLDFVKNNIKDDSKDLGTGEGKVAGPNMGIYNPK